MTIEEAIDQQCYLGQTNFKHNDHVMVKVRRCLWTNEHDDP